MNKEEFLNKLRDKLEVLEESEVEDIINEYSEHIDQKVKKKINESDVIKEFGDVDELVCSILSAYKVNKNFVNKNKESFVDEFIDNCKQVFDKLIKVVSHGSVKEILYLCLYILITLVIILIIRIPFEFIIDGVHSIIYSFPEPIYEVFNVFNLLIVNLVYFALSFVIVIKILKEKLLDNVMFVYEETKVTEEIKEKNSKNKKVKEEKEEEKVIVRKETKIKYKNERTFLDSIGDMIKCIFRCFAFIVAIPFVFGVVGCSVGLAFVIMFIVKYIFFVGPLLAIIGCLVLFIVISECLLTFVFKKNIKFLRLFISFIVSLVLIGLGVGVSIFEFASLDIKEFKGENNVLIYEDSLEYKNENIYCFGCENIEIKVDNALSDNMIKVVAYGFGYETLDYYSHEYEMYENGNLVNVVDGDYYSRLDFYKLFDRVKNDLKNGKLYSYNDYGNIRMIIYANDNTYRNIKAEVRY